MPVVFREAPSQDQHRTDEVIQSLVLESVPRQPEVATTKVLRLRVVDFVVTFENAHSHKRCRQKRRFCVNSAGLSSALGDHRTANGKPLPHTPSGRTEAHPVD